MNEPPLHYELDVQPQTAARAWHAVLRPAGGEECVEFDSPLALARHLAQFLTPNPQPRRGLR
jgi:hypothetical protein